MKYIVLYLLISIFSKINSFEMPEGGSECLKELGLDPSELEDLIQKRSDNIEPSQSGKCLSLCIVKKNNLLKDDGEINEAAILKKVSAGVSVNLEQCKSITGVDDCDKYHKMFMCIHQEVQKKVS